MAEKPPTRNGRAGGKGGPASRREMARRTARRAQPAWRRAVQEPAAARGLLVGALFALAAGAIMSWARDQPLVAAGRVMTETRLVREEFSVEDTVRTESRREVARQSTPRVYTANRDVFEGIRSSLERLPTALADAETVERVTPEIRNEFGLTEAQLSAIRAFAVEGQASEAWKSRVRALVRELLARPILDRESYQSEQTQANRRIEVRAWDQPPDSNVPKERAFNVEGARLLEEINRVVALAGFTEPVAGLIETWLVRSAQPTYTFDAEATRRAKEGAATAVGKEYATFPKGEPLHRRGDRLSEDARRIVLREHEEMRRIAGLSDRALAQSGAFLAALMATAGGAFYVWRFCPKIARNPARGMAVALLVLGGLGVSAWASVMFPQAIALTVTAPTVLVAMVLIVSHDQRTALALSSILALLVGIALRLPAPAFLTLLAGVGVAVWRLGEIRHRNTLMRGALATAAALAASTAAYALLVSPRVEGVWEQIGIDTAAAAAGGVAAGLLLLGSLPLIERLFDITTGMTLIELRDPRQPLLRRMQERAPGTYNHSLTVATLAESAAESIGAVGLHVYVGALYHDIGKINKPDYFVENQARGVNRHSKLSPAMSLLVIVGHVKDGIELAREYGLPRSLHHYIESHHGTTRVEYFFQQARQQAEEAEGGAPAEIENRYPGPRPRTKEAAILMLCDAVEGATRAMAEPTPSRIESLVGRLATKRLMDGQFDECDLTLRELQQVEASIVKSLIAIYHGRIQYPSSAEAPPETQAFGGTAEAPPPRAASAS